MNTNTACALRLEDVTFRYRDNAKRNILDHVSLRIDAGTVTVLMGSSGCGKSTLAAVLAGLYPENGGRLESGTIELFGQNISELSPQKRAALLTIMFQNADLQFCMETLRKEMQFCMENICVPPEEMDTRIDEAAKTLNVTNLLDRRLHTLSGGEKQKAALCCLYVMESRCILLDEAFANLDSDTVRALIPLLRAMRDRGRTIVAIDHRLEHWLTLADEIIILGEGGRVVERDIHPDTLERHYPVFEREGLLYPKRRERHEPPRTSEAAAITLKGVSILKGVPKKRLFGLSKQPEREYLVTQADAEFPKGSMTAVLGSSGTGKTTTFLSVLRQHPYEGEILLEGTDIRRIPTRELFRRVGIVFQNPGNQFVTQQVDAEVARSLRVREPSLTEEQATEKAHAMLEEYGLYAYRRYSPYMLSQGQQRRLAVLAALAGGQKTVLLDEPTYGQDYRSTTAIMHRLSQSVKEEGLTVVFITHDAQLAQVWADRVYVLRDKRFVRVAPEALEEDMP